VYVSQLRRKLETGGEEHYFLTEPGAGYRFVRPA
jgi:DNA-binding response OmpR family regulator